MYWSLSAKNLSGFNELSRDMISSKKLTGTATDGCVVTFFNCNEVTLSWLPTLVRHLRLPMEEGGDDGIITFSYTTC